LRRQAFANSALGWLRFRCFAPAARQSIR
jgi:hypothetical protein